MNSILRLFTFISARRRAQIFLLLILGGGVAVTEFILLYKFSSFLNEVAEMSNSSTGSNFASFGVQLAFSIVLVLMAKIILVVAQTRIGFGLGGDISRNILSNLLASDPEYFLSVRKSDALATVIVKANNVVNQQILPLINIINSLFLLAGIVIFAGVERLDFFFLAMLLFGVFYLIIFLLLRRKIAFASSLISKSQSKIFSILERTYTSYREIFVYGEQGKINRLFRDVDIELRKSTGDLIILSSLPKFVVESMLLLGALGVIWYSYSFTTETDGALAGLSNLVLLGLIAQRTVPVAQQCYQSIVQVKGSMANLCDVLSLLPASPRITPALEPEVVSKYSVPRIKLEGMCFKYRSFKNEDKEYVLNDINIELSGSEWMLIKGKTGSGKTTLLALIAGMLEPSQGVIFRDSAWVENGSLAIVTQDSPLFEGTLCENLSFFCKEEVSDFEIEQSLDIARLDISLDFACTGSLDSILSGGQKMRLGVARAILRKPKVLLLDEPTAPLDDETSRSLLTKLKDWSRVNDVMVIIVSHDNVVEKFCDKTLVLG